MFSHPIDPPPPTRKLSLTHFMHFMRSFILPLSVAVLSLLIHVVGLDNRLDYDRTGIQSGEWWLMITGHLCHLDWPHLALNVFALMIIWELFFRPYPALRASLECLGLALAVSLGIYWFNPTVNWYVGLSGVLHGLFAMGILREVPLKKPLSLVVALGLALKIMWEQGLGPTTGFLFQTDNVLVDAHLYGAVGGLIILLIELPLIKRANTLRGAREKTLT